MSDIVISGISGAFPQSDNVEEFKKNLLNKVYLVGDPENRIKFKFHNISGNFGLMKNLDKFDYEAFFIPLFAASKTDPQGYIVLERVFEALIDAGVSPSSLKGTKTGVYAGCFNFDALEHWMAYKDSSSGHASIGCSAYSLSNRISFYLGCHGPSFTVDTACSSSGYALNLAFEDIKNGKCESAIVIGSNMILNPFLAKDFSRAGAITKDISRPFDKNASGFVRSEACCVLFLQKADKARRVYATVLNSRTNCDGYKKEGPTVPSVEIHKELYRETYEGAKINPNEVDFLEAHATSTVVGDVNELKSIDEYFCKNRDRPLNVGSVKGNTGHCEGGSGNVSVIKAILMFENGKILPNINITELRDDCPGLVENRIRIVQEVEDFDGKIIGLSNFGVFGTNSHVILKRNEKHKIDGGFPSDEMPRLLLWSGRTEDAVNFIFDSILAKPLDDEFLALLQCSQIESTITMLKRGFAIFKSNQTDRQTICVDRQIEHLKKTKRPIVFVYSGLGSQWLQMGRDLIKIPIIAESIVKCHEVLMSKDIDLIDILTSTRPETFECSTSIFVGLAAIQIALTDLLFKIGINPNFFIGHSFGELGCAYADGTLSLKETILTAYSRGIAINEGNFESEGSMAAIAMGYEDLAKILPNEIEIACHNSSESCTISGPVESVKEFVIKVKSEGYLAKIVNSTGVAFHSSYISECGPILEEKLKKIILNPKKRSSKWISTSLADACDDEYSSVHYHVNNMLNQVRFADGLKKLPEDSLMIEIAPHGLLLPILKQSIPNGVFESLTKRETPDGVIFLLQALGKIFQNGVDMDIRQIYPKIDFPVSRGTPTISSLIKWNHKASLPIPMFDPFLRCDKRNVTISLRMSEYSFLKGHKIDDRIILPATYYSALAGETLAMMHGVIYKDFPICFEDIKFLKSTTINENDELELTITIQRGSGKFEVVGRDETICSGIVRAANSDDFVIESIGDIPENLDDFLDRDGFYRELKLRGYQYEGNFRLVEKVQNHSGTQRFGEIEWTENLICFLDCMNQPYLTCNDTRELALPVSLRKVVYDPVKHCRMLENLENCRKVIDKDGNEKIFFDLLIDTELKIFRCGGAEVIESTYLELTRKRTNESVTMENYEFISHFPTKCLSLENVGKFSVQLMMENYSSGKINVVEIDENEDDLITKHLVSSFNEIPLVSATFNLFTKRTIEAIEDVAIHDSDDFSNCGPIDLLITSNSLKLNEFFDKINEKGILMLRNFKSLPILPENFKFIAEIQLPSTNIFMIRNTPIEEFSGKLVEIPSTFESFEWIEELKKIHESSDNIIIHSNCEFSGILGFFKCLLKESSDKKMKCFVIEDENAPKFDINGKFYKDQLNLGLTINVYKNGKWGTYRHLAFSQEIDEKSHFDHTFVYSINKGEVSSLKWVSGDVNPNDNNIVDVHYSAINFRDVLIASSRISFKMENENRISAQYKCGFEFSGVTKSGKRVAGVCDSKAITNYIDTSRNHSFLFEIPDHITLDEAATIPVVYLTVYFAFFIKTKIQKGKSILIHSGTGGVGQAAIRVALAHGLKVYTTCGSKEKREFLLKEFPQLKDEDIGNSRNVSFEKMIMKRTHGRGVDYVLNSLAEDKMQASLRCLAAKGIFLEVGKYDLLAGSNIKLNHFLKEIEYVPVFFHLNLLNENVNLGKDLMEKFKKDFDSGIVKPLNRTIFKANEVEKAFRFMSSGKHIGKILIQIRDPEIGNVTYPIQVKPRIFFDPSKVYIIPGGLGGMGMELADWMILRNCKKLVLSSSRGISNSYQSYRIKIWKSYGVNVEICTSDITTKDGCEEMIQSAVKMGPIGGIFNLAVVLNDATIKNQTPETFEKVFKPKALSTKYLDELSRILCPQLEFFVVFSSIACGRGHQGQTNYGQANCVIEKIIEKRHAANFPAKAIQFGPIGDAGLLSKVQSDVATFFGYNFQSIKSCWDMLDKLLLRNEAIFSSFICASKKKTANTFDDLLATLLNALGIVDESTIDPENTLAELGVDSISGVEIQQAFQRELGLSLSLKEVRAKTFKEVKEVCQNAMRKEEKCQ